MHRQERRRPRFDDQLRRLQPLDDRHELLPLDGRGGKLHLEHADAALRRRYIRLGVGNACQQRQVEGIQEALERLVDRQRFLHPVRDHREADVVDADAPGDQEVADEIRRRMDVDRRRCDRNHDAVRAAEHLLQDQAGRARGRVDHELARVVRHAHVEAAHAPGLRRRRVRAVDAREIHRPLLEPVQARALRVVIHQRGRDPDRGEVARQVGRDGGLARAALRVDDQCGVGSHGRAQA